MKTLDVTNLSKKERLDLFEKWKEARRNSFTEDSESCNDITNPKTEYLLEGHGIYLTEKELSDPSFLVEW